MKVKDLVSNNVDADTLLRMRRVVTVAYMRDLLNLYTRQKISFSKMVEDINARFHCVSAGNDAETKEPHAARNHT